MTSASTSPAASDAERADLLAALATARSTLINTTRGLSDEQAGARPTVSELCLGGLIKHAAAAEESWIRFVEVGPSAMHQELPEGVTWADFAAGTAREIPQWAIDWQDNFRMLPGDTLIGALGRYEQVAKQTEQVINAVPDLSATHPLPDAPWYPAGEVRSIRRVLMHLIAETSQHAGHADILRETLDGQKST